jgi:hypothetical protein
MICSVCKKAEAVGYEYISHPDEPPRALCGACAPRNAKAFGTFAGNDLYQHEAIRQLAAEFKLQKMTAQDISEDEITYMLKAFETERMNPNHYPPAKWVISWFIFLRETGNTPRCWSPPASLFSKLLMNIAIARLRYFSNASGFPNS